MEAARTERLPGVVREAIARLRPDSGAFRWTVVCALLTLVKLWLVSAQTVYAIAPSPHDDQLFLFQAASLLRGDWLGRLTDTTLVKGPVYALWLAVNHVVGTRLLASQAILYVVACAVLAVAVRPVLHTPWRRALLYLSLLFNPGSWADGPATRVIRDGIYPSLTLLLLALAIGATLRLRDAPRASAVWAAGAGMVGALFTMTREEGIWLVPSLTIVAVAPFLRARPLPWRPWLGAIAAAALAYALPTTAVAGMNWSRYGLFETCETRADYFTSAYGALTRVKTSSWNPYVPVPVEARAKVFSVSPTFQEIAAHVERDAPNWASASCQAVGVCDDIAGGFFMWDFRTAVARAGEYQDGPRARAFYERLTREVDAACRRGELDCLPPRSTMTPPWRADYAGPVASAVVRAAVHVATFSEVTPYPTLARGDEPELAEFERITNERLPRSVVELRGVVTSRGGDVISSVVDHLGSPVQAFIERDVAAATAISEGGDRSIRLRVSAHCAANCRLLLFTGGGRPMIVELSERPVASGNPAVTWVTESATIRPLAARERSEEVRLATLSAITRAYALAFPVLSLLAAVLLAWGLVRARRQRTAPDLLLPAVALLVGIVTRSLVLALVHATSVPAINVQYLSPAHGLLVAFVMLVLLTSSKAVRAPRPEMTAGCADGLPPVQT